MCVIGILILIWESIDLSNFAQKLYFSTNTIKCEVFYKIVPIYITHV